VAAKSTFLLWKGGKEISQFRRGWKSGPRFLQKAYRQRTSPHSGGAP